MKPCSVSYQSCCSSVKRKSMSGAFLHAVGGPEDGGVEFHVDGLDARNVEQGGGAETVETQGVAAQDLGPDLVGERRQVVGHLEGGEGVEQRPGVDEVDTTAEQQPVRPGGLEERAHHVGETTGLAQDVGERRLEVGVEV